MVIKDLRQAMQQRMFIIPFIAIHMFMLVALAIEWHNIQDISTTLPAHRYTSRITFWFVAYVVLGVVLPLRTFNALQEETHEGNAELLMMAGISRWRIVRGKWLVHVGLVFVITASLFPYLIVRYFFGAFDFWENVIQLLGVIGCSLASGALVIGASGYKSYTTRIIVTLIALIYLLGTSIAVSSMAGAVSREVGGRIPTWALIYGAIYAIGVFLILILLGLQLGRAHLKLSLLPWESSPTTAMLTMIICMPFILIAGTVATCGYGGVVVEAILIYAFFQVDRGAKR